MIDNLVESLPAARVLLLVNYRPEYNHVWGSKTYYRQLRVDPLSAGSAGELLDALLGSDAGLGPLKRLLIERTEANRLFLEEGVRTLVETVALGGERGAYRLTWSIQRLTTPATVQSILAARIDRLAPEAKRLLQAAAVIGKATRGRDPIARRAVRRGGAILCGGAMKPLYLVGSFAVDPPKSLRGINKWKVGRSWTCVR